MTSSIIYLNVNIKGVLRMVHINTAPYQNILFKAIRISSIYIWVLDSYDKLIVYLSCKIAR